MKSDKKRIKKGFGKEGDFMDNFMKFMEEKVAPVFGKVATNPYLKGIRDGMIATVPFTIIGSIFIIICQFPNDAWKAMVEPYAAMLNVPNAMTIGIIALIVAFSVGASLASELKQDAITGGTLSFVGFMFLQVDAEFNMVTKYFGSKGIFTALVVAIFAVKVLQIFTVRKWVIRFPEGVPPAVAKSFSALIPGIVILTSLFVIRCVFGIEIPELVIKMFSPLVFALNSYPGILVYMVVSQLLWCVGIHGQSVLNTVGTPIFLTYITANTEAFNAGQPIPYITATGFIPWFISLGGAGATLSLVIIMCFSKEKSLRTLGRLALPAGIFEINEPITFGLPIVMNPTMMIPFVLVDVVLLTGTYFLMYFDIIGRCVVQVPWIMPPVIGAYLATGANIPAAIWAFCGIFISAAIYYPFIKMEERSRLKAQAEQD